jgi:hypothetical protein
MKEIIINRIIKNCSNHRCKFIYDKDSDIVIENTPNQSCFMSSWDFMLQAMKKP